jgi:hypothetical protein
MLWQFTNKNKYGNLRRRIIYSPSGEGFEYNPKGLGNFVNVQVFKYKSKSNFPPALANVNGKLYMVPDWKEVLPETTINDITYTKPKPPKVKLEKTTFKFESKSSPGSFYKVTVEGDKVKCNCAGQYRAKDKVKGCIHMQEVRSRIAKS